MGSFAQSSSPSQSHGSCEPPSVPVLVPGGKVSACETKMSAAVEDPDSTKVASVLDMLLLAGGR